MPIDFDAYFKALAATALDAKTAAWQQFVAPLDGELAVGVQDQQWFLLQMRDQVVFDAQLKAGRKADE